MKGSHVYLNLLDIKMFSFKTIKSANKVNGLYKVYITSNKTVKLPDFCIF